MNITWVNHASFIFEYDGIKLITDPWIEGTAFDNGWALLSPSVLSFEKFSEITHIWFSHEHPDHFSPPNLNKIPVEYRKSITVLFQRTTDRKVAEYCKKAGFGNVVELKENEYYSLSPNVQCMCNPFTDGDSWLYLKTDKYNLLNLNDCIIDGVESALTIKNKIDTVDILFTQFGYANKIGNETDTEARKAESAEKLRRIDIQNNVFTPKTIIPFASYVYFCHEENKYMNDGMNRIDDVHHFIETTLKTESVVLYPGNQWLAGTSHQSQDAIDKYLTDYLKLAGKEMNFIQSKERVQISDLTATSNKFKETILSNTPSPFIKFYPAMKIWLHDYNQAYTFNFRQGFVPATIEQDLCDISLSSTALLYSFKFLWGGDTLQINARFQTPSHGDYFNARVYYSLAASINRGETVKSKEILKTFIFLSPVYKKIRKRIR